jgi:hypothetical protein
MHPADTSTDELRGSVMEHFNWGLCIAVIVVIAVTALIRKDGRHTTSRGGPSGWSAGGYDGADFGGHHHGHDSGGGFDVGGGSDGGGGGD